MTNSDRPRFSQLVLAMAATFSKPADSAMLLGYWIGLEDLPVDQIETAIVRCMRSSEYLPTVAQIRSAVAGPAASPKLRAASQWPNAVAWARHSGRFLDHEGDDPITRKVVEVMSGELRDLPCEGFERSRLERRFCDLYAELADGDRKALAGTEAKLIGTEVIA